MAYSFCNDLPKMPRQSRTWVKNMRRILFSLTLFAVCFHDNHWSNSPKVGYQIANAESAAVDNNAPVEIKDNYGNPENFVKYIIRKPNTIS